MNSTEMFFKVGSAQRNAKGKVLHFINNIDQPKYTTANEAIRACVALAENHKRAGLTIRAGDYGVFAISDTVVATLDEHCHPVCENGTFIRFEPREPKPKTKVWAVLSNDGGQIGQISWYGPWRKYCFMPWANTVFEQVCLREIALFCEAETNAHKHIEVQS